MIPFTYSGRWRRSHQSCQSYSSSSCGHEIGSRDSWQWKHEKYCCWGRNMDSPLETQCNLLLSMRSLCCRPGLPLWLKASQCTMFSTSIRNLQYKLYIALFNYTRVLMRYLKDLWYLIKHVTLPVSTPQFLLLITKNKNSKQIKQIIHKI